MADRGSDDGGRRARLSLSVALGVASLVGYSSSPELAADSLMEALRVIAAGSGGNFA